MVKRKRFTPEEKISILREYLEYQIPIDQLEHKYGIKRNLIHSWKLKLFRDGLEIFSISSKNNNHTAETHQGAQTDEYDMLFESIEKIRSKIQETNKLINEIYVFKTKFNLNNNGFNYSSNKLIKKIKLKNKLSVNLGNDEVYLEELK